MRRQDAWRILIVCGLFFSYNYCGYLHNGFTVYWFLDYHNRPVLSLVMMCLLTPGAYKLHLYLAAQTEKRRKEI